MVKNYQRESSTQDWTENFNIRANLRVVQIILQDHNFIKLGDNSEHSEIQRKLTHIIPIKNLLKIRWYDKKKYYLGT